MSEKTGYFFVVDEPHRAFLLEQHIGLHGTFTDVVSAPDWHAKQAEIFFVSLGYDEIHFAALVRRGNQVATKKYQLRFTQLYHFHPPLPLAFIEARISARLRSYFLRSSQGTGVPVPKQTWVEVVNAIKSLQPTAADAIDRLEQLRDFSSFRYFDRPGAAIVAQQRDATNVALRMAGFDPAPVLDWSPPPGEVSSVAPFLHGLPSARLREDQMIAHDAKVFGGWERIADHVVGATVFASGNNRLTVMNVNRHPIEQVLGVDLLYFVHDFNAYVLVQYKRMVYSGREFEYRPLDKSYKSELERMQRFGKAFPDAPKIAHISEYRLSSAPFYFKLCPEAGFDPTSTEMMRGMYLPLEYWELLMTSEQVRGPEGGVRITFENSGRYFNNTDFISLVQSGWIGSRVVQTNAITSFIREAIADRRSLMLAAKMPFG